MSLQWMSLRISIQESSASCRTRSFEARNRAREASGIQVLWKGEGCDRTPDDVLRSNKGQVESLASVRWSLRWGAWCLSTKIKGDHCFGLSFSARFHQPRPSQDRITPAICTTIKLNFKKQIEPKQAETETGDSGIPESTLEGLCLNFRNSVTWYNLMLASKIYLCCYFVVPSFQDPVCIHCPVASCIPSPHLPQFMICK